MVVEYNGKRFLTDNDLGVSLLGFYPGKDIKNSELRQRFIEQTGRDFLGGDEHVAYAQTLVSRGVDFDTVEEEILKDIQDGKKIEDITWSKTSTGIGRGHSLGGLSGVVLGVHGTKMIDSGLTGFVASRSLTTSSRRRETTEEEIVIPEALMKRKDLLDEYLSISRDVFKMSKEFKEKFKKLGGVEVFNKVIPYNNPNDLYIVLPLDTMATLAFEVQNDRKGFLPRELHALNKKLDDIAKQTGINVMHAQRKRVPRDTYLHYTVFKDPELGNYALEKGEEVGMSIKPVVLDVSIDFTPGFMKGLEYVKSMFEEAKKETNPERLYEKSMKGMLAMRDFTGENNEAVRVKVADTLSWRVWSEQKRHATLRQHVESVYSAGPRAYNSMKELWSRIKAIGEGGEGQLPLGEIDKIIVVDEKLRNNPELLNAYVYHTAKQLMFYGKMIQEGFEERDALYIVPKNIRLRTLENYDLINLIDLEHPLRLCSSCEPERQRNSWAKREVIAQAVPELDYFLQPKCNIGMCTEGKPFGPCGRIRSLREGYTQELHDAVKSVMLSRES